MCYLSRLQLAGSSALDCRHGRGVAKTVLGCISKLRLHDIADISGMSVTLAECAPSPNNTGAGSLTLSTLLRDLLAVVSAESVSRKRHFVNIKDLPELCTLARTDDDRGQQRSQHAVALVKHVGNRGVLQGETMQVCFEPAQHARVRLAARL